MPLLTYEAMSVHWFDWREGLLDLLNVKRRHSTQMYDLQRRVRVQIFT